MVPKVSLEQLQIAEQKTDSIYSLIASDSISFIDAVRKYSASDTKLNEGKVTNPYYGTSKLTNDFVDNYTKRAVLGLKSGEITRPFLGTDNRGNKVMKILKVDTRVEKHIANLKDDYQEIQQAAIQRENQKAIKKIPKLAERNINKACLNEVRRQFSCLILLTSYQCLYIHLRLCSAFPQVLCGGF